MLPIGPLLESAKHDVGDILRESPYQERETLKAYYDVLDLSKDKNLRLEEYARDMIARELAHQDEMDKMSVKRSDHARGTPSARLELCR